MLRIRAQWSAPRRTPHDLQVEEERAALTGPVRRGTVVLPPLALSELVSVPLTTLVNNIDYIKLGVKPADERLAVGKTGQRR